jgi:tetratricopeptide (TPR) repeat protein
MKLEKEILLIEREAGDFDMDACLSEARRLSNGAADAIRGSRGAQQIVNTLRNYLYNTEGFSSHPEECFFHRALAMHKGKCYPLSAVHLFLAELNRLPIFYVKAPGHIFVRWDSGAKINIETTDKGVSAPDDAYVRSFGIDPLSIEKGVFLKSMPPKTIIASAWMLCGNTFSGRGQTEKAMRAFEKAYAINPKDPEIAANIGYGFLRREEYQKAIEFYNRVIYLDSRNRALVNRAIAYFRTGQADLAFQDFGRAIETNPGYAKAHYDRGFAHFENGNYAEAAADFDAAVRINHRYRDALYNRLLLDLKQGRYVRAGLDYLRVWFLTKIPGLQRHEK